MSKKNNKNMILPSLDDFKKEIEREQMERWSKTRDISVTIRVKVIDREPNLWDRIRQKLYTTFLYPRILVRSQDPLVSILDNDYCRFLAVANSIDTYKRYPQQELQIKSIHQDLSAEECIGLVTVYHKEQQVSQVRWRLRLSNGLATLSVTAPAPIGYLLVRGLYDQNDLIYIP